MSSNLKNITMPKLKRRVRLASKPSIVETEDDSNTSLIEVEKELNGLLVARKTVVHGLILALLCKQHVMLHGPGGLAKTLAANELFKRVEGGCSVFKIQLSKGTLTEHLFGPVNLEKFRRLSVYEYNSVGMLPTATFAILDEVYRAPDSLLSVLMSVLNEREVFSSGKAVKCPLETAVGTTNFVSDNPELVPFHDRWLLNIKVTPLTSSEDRATMFRRALAPTAPRRAGISYDNLIALQEKVARVKFSDEMLALYVELATTMISASGMSHHVSDRRTVQALSLVRAEAVFNGRDYVTIDDFSAARYGMILVGEAKEEQQFDSALSVIASQYVSFQQESQVLATADSLLERITDRYTTGLPLERLRKQEAFCRDAINNLRAENLTNNVVIRQLNEKISKLDQFLLSITDDIMRLTA